MKTLLTALILIISISASAQVDSARLKSGKLTLRVNDYELLSPSIAFNPDFEILFDSTRFKLRSGTYPTGTTLLTIDSVENGEAVNLYIVVKRLYNPSTATAIDRIITALRAMNSNYVTSRIDALVSADVAAATAARQLGKRILRRGN